MAESRFSKPKNIGNRFVKLKCRDCGNEQVTYTRITSVVQCNICGATIARPTGGTFEVAAEIIEGN
ncbi:MAG TPA: 30S ribosomal protein S27e [Thermoplasmataceae archaeon]|nr:30S ribosomal protein S27e [Thermoplasmatales archaeon AK]HLH86297.1 30S ribosomal protein S27e [Thermoplasmataceae archaeon]